MAANLDVLKNDFKNRGSSSGDVGIDSGEEIKKETLIKRNHV